MKKYLFILFLLIALPVFAAPSNTMSIAPAAVDGATITSSDENTRNNVVTTTYNAHSHTDISQVGNNLKIGDNLAGNKYLTAYNADANSPYFEYDDTNNYWIVSTNGVAPSLVLQGTGLIFEGTTDDIYETTFSVTDPTADKTITFPNDTGTVMLKDGSSTQTVSAITNFTGTLQISGTTLAPSITELNYVDGVTSAIQTQLANILSGTTSFSGLTASADLDIGAYELRAQTLESDVATGTAPLTITSTTKVSNLNVDQLDGFTASDFFEYFTPDGTVVMALDNGSNGVDRSDLHHALTLTSLADSDLVTGKVSPLCYDYDGTNDAVQYADHALFSGMAALTLEAWVYRDATGATHNIIGNTTDNYIAFSITDTVVAGQIVTDTGTEVWSVNHGLAGSGGAQWVYIVVAWDNTGVAQIYVNGADVGDGDDGGNGTVSNSANVLRIGASSSTITFNGKIDGFRMLRRKMSATEVLARYNAHN